MASLCRCCSRSLSRLDAPKRNSAGSSQRVAGHLVDHHQVADRLLGGADAAGQLHPAHARRCGAAKSRTASSITSATGGVAAGRDLAGRGLDEVAAGQQRQPGRAPDVVQRGQLAGLQDHLQVRGAAGRLGRDDLVEHLQVVARPGTRRGRSPCRSRWRRPRRRRATSCSLVASAARPDGKAVATEATCDRRAAQRVDRGRDQVGVDADRGDRRHVTGRTGPGGAALRAQRAHLARGVRAFQGGQVDHPDRGVDRPRLGGGLDAAGGQRRRPGLGADLVDAGQAVQEPPQRRVVAGDVRQLARARAMVTPPV